MTRPTGGEEPRDDAEVVGEGGSAAVATTAARALVMGAALTGSDALYGLRAELLAVGVRDLPPLWGGWDERRSLFDESDEVLQSFGLLEEIQAREEQRWRPSSDGGQPTRPARVDLWRRISVRPLQRNVIAWLRAVMTDAEPVAAAASAVALSVWRRPKDTQIPPALEAAREIRDAYAHDGPAEAQLIARAAEPAADRAPRFRLRDSRERSDEPPNSVSTMVHGTGAWRGDWWYPGGGFHSYIREKVTTDLYSGGAAFSWSGAYRRSDRDEAAKRLAAWAETIAAAG